LLRLRRRREGGQCQDPPALVGLVVLLLSTAWCMPHLLDSCVDPNSSSIRTTAHNMNSGSSSCNNNNHNNNNSSTMLLLHRRSKLQPGHHNNLLPATFYASTAERWGILLVNAASLSKTFHHELWHPWLINKGANRGVLHHGLAAPTTPPWMRSPRAKKC
jgi:hypothetical protein